MVQNPSKAQPIPSVFIQKSSNFNQILSVFPTKTPQNTMKEDCFQPPSSTPTKKINKTSDFVIFSTIFSHPLYLSYLIFFSPYLLKLLSFLSPLFITTSLLIISLLTTIVPRKSILNSKDGFFSTAYNTLLEKLRPEFDNGGENLVPVEELEVYKIVFGTPTIGTIEGNPDENGRLEENPLGFSGEKALQEEKEMEVRCESLTMKLETVGANPDKVKEQVKKFECMFTRTGSEAVKATPFSESLKPRTGSLRVDNEKKLTEAFSETVGGQQYLGSFGSMRKEKEWRRTLACKLFEERHNGSVANANGCVKSEERMDLLWETYETETNKGKRKDGKMKGSRREKVREDFMLMNHDDYNDDDDDECDDDENGKLCCLQALKLSAGKMNLNMGRPSFIKFGKAFKGIGWLQSHVRRSGKKGYK